MCCAFSILFVLATPGLAANRANYVQDPVDRLVDLTADRFTHRAITGLPLGRAQFDSATLAKSGQLALPPSVRQVPTDVLTTMVRPRPHLSQRSAIADAPAWIFQSFAIADVPQSAPRGEDAVARNIAEYKAQRLAKKEAEKAKFQEREAQRKRVLEANEANKREVQEFNAKLEADFQEGKDKREAKKQEVRGKEQQQIKGYFEKKGAQMAEADGRAQRELRGY